MSASRRRSPRCFLRGWTKPSSASTRDQGRIELAGPELVFGTLFDRLGLGAGRDPLFRHMVICRLFDPGNKLRTINYLRRYLGKTCEPAEIYALVDSLRLTEMRVSSAAPAAAFLISTPLARVPLCLLVDADGRPVAGRLLDRAVGGGVSTARRSAGERGSVFQHLEQEMK